MGLEIDFLPVGEGAKSGDAICARYGNLLGNRNEQTIFIIDGGFLKSGELMVKHIKEYYGNPERIDYVFLTHPDLDHASGLREIFNNFKVTNFGMHKAWNHSGNIKNAFKDGRVSSNSIKDRLKDDLDLVCDLEQIALKNGSNVFEPFSDNCFINNELTILGPSINYYEDMLVKSDSTPQCYDDKYKLSSLKSIYESIKNKIQEDWFKETLFEPIEETNPWNNTSLIILLNADGKKCLFTGDAGVPALMKAADKADSLNINMQDIDFYDIPHHGSKRNLSPKVLDRIIGKKLQSEPSIFNKTAIISASKEGEPKHPSKKVMNALRRRGVRVFVTRAGKIVYPNGISRDWPTAKAEPLYFEFED